MRFNIRAVTMMVCLAAALQGCISSRSYVDPLYHRATYSDLKRAEPPYALQIKIEFQRNGIHQPSVDMTVRQDIERALRASGVAIPYDGTSAADGELNFVVNNVANVAKSGAKGFGTGLTFGMVGTHVTDGYEMTVRLRQGDLMTERRYEHAIMTTVGNASGPPGVAAVSLENAFTQVIDDMVLNSLKELQANGSLLPRTAVMPVHYTQTKQ